MSSMIGGTTMTTLLIVLILGSAQNQFPNTNSFATSARKGSEENNDDCATHNDAP